ncbi:MAG: SEC-C domain-containing protein, partial [Chloroflexi bacterium]|nr:SEC-C domain-containing protein [Chloroflexota bacterium]
DRIRGFMEWAGLEDDIPIEHGLVTKSIETAHTKVEAYNFDLRKHLVDYDDVMNAQRDMIYTERRKILSGADLRANVLEMVHEELDEALSSYVVGPHEDQWDLMGLLTELNQILPLAPDMTPDELARKSREEIEERIHEHADLVYQGKEQDLSPEGTRILERLVMLQTIDNLWVEHLTRMEDMRQGIGLRAYGQSDPLVAYKREAYEMYNDLRRNIRHTIARTIYHATLVRQAAPQAPQPSRTNRDEAAGGRPLRVPAGHKVGRNDPCPCGSGKKYKRCHGAAA